ncbi:probable Altered inheritance of mitochondria protein 32 [Zygosaccharomyces bailii]|nr:probable Altered inheritance of mitochondria protein 32 [Zygosaccharomyces bailii]
MFIQGRHALRFLVRKVYYHRNYVQINLNTETLAPLSCQCQNYNREINALLPRELQLDTNSPIPRRVPGYKKHVLVLSPQDKSATELEWMSHWQSKLELNPLWPYSIIGKLKSYLKNTKLGSDVLVNAISMQSGSIKAPKRDPHEKAHIFVLPDMKLYKISQSDVEEFAYFLGEGHTKPLADHKLSFTDFLKGANNVTNETDIIPESRSNNEIFEYEDNLADWLLVCGHNQRDRRCGLIGQALIKQISAEGLYKDKNIAVISHIGGHKFAGNVILYNRTGLNKETGLNQLDSLWFARISPPNIIPLLERINAGEIPKEYYRGGLSMN